MMEKWYELTCDYCGARINYYFGRRPSRAELEADGVYCTATKHFCNEKCWSDWNHDRQQKQYLNIHPDGKIHNEHEMH